MRRSNMIIVSFWSIFWMTALQPLRRRGAWALTPPPLPLLLSTTSTTGNNSNKRPSVFYRDGTSFDSWSIAWQLGLAGSSPFGIDGKHFCIAYNNNQRYLGFVQIRPLSVAESAMQEETDDVMWDEFEANQDIQIPVGWASLPWTAQYQAMEKQAAAAQQRQQQRGRDRRREMVLRETKAETPPTIYELTSLWVHPQYRQQGIGKALVERILKRHYHHHHHPPHDE